ncbi:MAG: IgGFc-binding protein, partial [Myxococcales bacterium]|nr:IgGFc-binding protein [Myxococcales bacterium]
SYIGCDYYPTVTQQYDYYNTAPANEYAVSVANAGNEDAMVTITRGNAMVYDTVVPAGQVSVITLPWVDALTKTTGPSVLVADGAYRLRSDRPVVVYQYNPLAASVTNDASILLPVNAWGQASMVASLPYWANYDLVGFYTVTASEDNTTVTLTPGPQSGTTKAGGGVAANGTGQVVLNQSDVLEVVTGSGDLSGTLVSADKPIQVISGHECTNVPINIPACDHLEESMYPIDTLAKDYIIVPPVQVPNTNQLKAQIVRIMAVADNTQITFTPDQGANQVLNAGQFFDLPMGTNAYRVSGSEPFMAVQFMVGQGAGFGTSDPAMLLSVPTAQFRQNYLFFAATNWVANFVDIIAPAGATVTVDGANVNAWTPVGATGFSVAHVQLSNAGNGNHTVNANQKVGISVYGVQDYGSYWYPGGLDLTINPQ